MTKTVLNLLWNKISKNFSTKKLVIDALANKQDLILDIATIRSNSLSAYLKPSTGIPAGDLASGVIPVVPTTVSSFTNDAKYVAEDDMQVDVIDANGHDYVDLGLPSGTLWATMNVGASSETDYGNYYKYGKGAEQYDNAQADYTGTEDPLDSSVDTAAQVWGGSWHMPTRAQMQELTANTTYQWVTNYKGSGINGGTFTATNGAVLFIPAAGYWDDGSQLSVGNYGYCWGSSPDGSYRAYGLSFGNGNKGVSNGSRKYGYSVRPVLNASKASKYATKAELSNVATSGSYNDLSDKPTIPTVPTNVSTFTNDANYVTQDTLDDILGVDVNGLTLIKEVLSDDDTTTGLINLIGQKADATDIQIITNQEIASLFDPYRGHAYVEIAGIKWATVNIGANSITDPGLYFQWGDTQGYTAAQVGSGEGQKYFGLEDYKYGNGTSSPDITGITKYNASDSLVTLEASDDAAVANWGGSWRMPTTAEFQALGNAVNTAWTADYQGSGVAGLVCTDKTDSSKTLFFPAAGYCLNGSVKFVGINGGYWSSSVRSSDVHLAYYLYFRSNAAGWDYYVSRFSGFAVRPVAD